MNRPIFDEPEKIKTLDRGNMLSFCINSSKLYSEAAQLAKKIQINYPKPDNIIVAGMGGSGIGGDLLKDWARTKTDVPIEVSREYNLPKYAGKKTLVLVSSASGDTEETLSMYLDALERKCMIYCVSSGGALLENAERLNVPHLRVPGGMPPRASLPYLFVPLLVCMEKLGLVKDVQDELAESLELLEKVSSDNVPQKAARDNISKKLALKVEQKVPVVYGYGHYRSVAIRFKQQFNENSKVPSKWEVFSELNHNEIVGWERAGDLAKCFSAIFIRDAEEPLEIHSRIEITKELLEQEGVDIFELQTQGNSTLARMLSTICIGDFTSVYLALLRGVDPTPVKTINYLKETLKQNGFRRK